MPTGPFDPKYTLKFPLFTKLLPKVYQTIPGVYQKWRKFKSIHALRAHYVAQVPIPLQY
eukprot:COSAG05_NODE_2872_length_2554_cov_2.243585_3_plen_59_part_00